MFATRVGFYKQPGAAVITVTGGTFTTDGLYSIRTFTSSGTLGISGGNLACEYLLVGGGGSGGSGTWPDFPAAGGGGGEGGQVLTGSTTINAGSYSVTVGGSQQNTTIGAILTALKGNNGGNASGGLKGSGGTGNPGADGGIGGNASSDSAANGQNGTASSISGTSVTYGGGGGGGGLFASGSDRVRGFGGTGGGGNGGAFSSPTTNPSNGTANRGGGGGGGYNATVGAGGSGIVIIRYLTAGTN
jgi:hypothetical protein